MQRSRAGGKHSPAAEMLLIVKKQRLLVITLQRLQLTPVQRSCRVRDLDRDAWYGAGVTTMPGSACVTCYRNRPECVSSAARG